MPPFDLATDTTLRAALEAGASAFDEQGSESRCRLLKQLVVDDLATLPRPGSGATLTRWRALAQVAAADLSLVKLYEGHADALAILGEAAGQDARAHDAFLRGQGRTFGMWAAEAPGARVTYRLDERGRATLDGTKAWCSGARHLDRAVLTVWSVDGDGPFLADVDLRQAAVSFAPSNWRAIGMAASDSGDVRFDHAAATLFGEPGFYLSRPGFWQGGAGLAACWHGGTLPVARTLHAQVRGRRDGAGWHRLLALGAIDRVLSANAALLREAAAWIDAHPALDARAWALRVRAAADDAAQRVIEFATRALGATPLCRDAAFARLVADLPVFVRQSHGDRDLVALGERLAEEELPSWPL